MRDRSLTLPGSNTTSSSMGWLWRTTRPRTTWPASRTSDTGEETTARRAGRYGDRSCWAPGLARRRRRDGRPRVSLEIQEIGPHRSRLSEMPLQRAPRLADDLRRHEQPDVSCVRLPEESAHPVRPSLGIGVPETGAQVCHRRVRPPEKVGRQASSRRRSLVGGRGDIDVPERTINHSGSGARGSGLLNALPGISRMAARIRVV